MNLGDELSQRKNRIERDIEEIFEKKRDHPLWESMYYYPSLGGKKLRPFLVMITVEAFEGPEERATPYATALELVHNFTLVHDDIMDQDDLRRAKKTLHKKVGDPLAINAGDGLFALSFKILSRSEIECQCLRELLGELSTSIIKVAEGQEEDIRFESTFDITEDDFINMIEKKTAYLFKAATRGGAIIAGCEEEQVKKMGEYARKMGLAFQIQDDYLDLLGDQGEIGKDFASDIAKGKKTLMVIKALSELSRGKKERLKEILEDEDNDPEEIEEAIDLMDEAGAIEYSKRLAQTYAEEAKSELDVIPEQKYRCLLEDLVDFMISREK